MAYPIATDPNPNLEERWTAWKAHGLAHDRAVRRRLNVVVIVAGAIALAVAIVYALLSP